MPKLRMTDQQRREKALMRALEKAKFENDLKYEAPVPSRRNPVGASSETTFSFCADM